MSSKPPKKIFVIAGEASGDLHGANLIDNLKKISGEPLDFYGVGGDYIRDTGAKEFFDLAHFHVTGLTDAIKRYPDYKRAAKIILASVANTRPDVVVLIDNPGFNLYLAEKIHALGIPIVYYIAPQLWAWAPKRILKIKKYIKKVLVVFEFEKKIYEDEGIPVSWVGHPLIDIVRTPAHDQRRKEDSRPQVALLPGSRTGELKMLFRVFAGASEKIRKANPDVRFVLIKAPTLTEEFYEQLMKKNGVRFELVTKNSYDTIRSSRAAIVCSGTATLECAILGTPMVITNKGTLLTYITAKALVKVPFLGLPNLVLREKRFPELLQFDATPDKLAAETLSLLNDTKRREKMKKDLEEVTKKLGGGGAGKRAAKEILAILE